MADNEVGLHDHRVADRGRMREGAPKMGNDKGQALVEFALILTLIVAVLFGIIEFGRSWYYANSLVSGARAGARFASIKPRDANFRAGVVAYTFAQISSSMSVTLDEDLFVNVSAYNSSGAAKNNFGNLSTGDAITVITRFYFDPLTGSIVPFFSGTKHIVRKATMRYEHG